jgi:hypothetical protein
MEATIQSEMDLDAVYICQYVNPYDIDMILESPNVRMHSVAGECLLPCEVRIGAGWLSIPCLLLFIVCPRLTLSSSFLLFFFLHLSANLPDADAFKYAVYPAYVTRCL